MATSAAPVGSTQVYWGDTHVHTAYSMDANMFGNTRLTPDDAYRFARGEAVVVDDGMEARIGRPLDFLVVSDHAEFLGAVRLVRSGDPDILVQPEGRRWFALLQEGGDRLVEAFSTEGGPSVAMPGGEESPWHEIVMMAEAANRPGEFTAFAAFEWTSTPGGDNLHRNVIFRDGPERTLQVAPFSFQDSEDPRDLWNYMADYEARTGGRVLAIPHNSNLSGGRMFAETDFHGQPMTADYAAERARWEPLMEVTQMKGDSEAHPSLSPDDEFADFGTWDDANIVMSQRQRPWMFPYQYARPALGVGLRIEQRTGVNPYRFGLVGGTDSHTTLATADDDNFWGKFMVDNPAPERALRVFLRESPAAVIYNWEMLASGLTAVWATGNSREELFDAMWRREVYATTGPRMTVRFFGGWDFEPADATRHDLAALGYAGGVPMGGELSGWQGDAPAFLVSVQKDPEGANLDRAQVVKGWLDAEGEMREAVYDVAWSGDRTPDTDGRLPPVGSTVQLDTASYRNSIGAPQLAATWRDPDFDPEQPAFYYVRVLEIPTPRWPAYDAARLGTELPEDAVLIHQERAYTSPIWYLP